MKNKFNRNFLLKNLLLLLTIFSVSIFNINQASATTYGPGYFHGLTHTAYGSSILRECNGETPFSSQYADKASLIDRIDQYRSGSCYSLANNFGARFIMQSMLNHKNLNADGTVKDEFDAWKTMINNDNVGIIWYENYVFSQNTMCYSNHHCNNSVTEEKKGSDYLDAYPYTGAAGQTADVLLFFHKDTKQVFYVIKKECANPIWDYNDLPWTINAFSEVSKDGSNYYKYPNATLASPINVQVGQNITWHNYVKNVGTAIDQNVKYYYHNHDGYFDRGTLAGRNGIEHSFPSGSNGTSTVVTSYLTGSDVFKATDADVGKTFCRRTEAYPGTKGAGNYTVTSAYACAKVYSGPPPEEPDPDDPDIPEDDPTEVVNWKVKPSTDLYVNGEYKGTATSDLGGAYTFDDLQVDDVVSWKNNVTNLGPDDTGIIYYFYFNNEALRERTSELGMFFGLFTGPLNLTGSISAGETISSESKLNWGDDEFKIQTSDIGKKFCRGTIAYPRRSGILFLLVPNLSNFACAKSKLVYSLTPSISIDPTGEVVIGQSIDINPSVSNSGPSQSDSVGWAVRVYKNGIYYADQLTGSSVFQVGNNSIDDPDAFPVDDSNFQPGDEVCFSLWLERSTNAGGEKESSKTCVTIGKQPSVQVWGGDLRSKGGVKTGLMTISGMYFGSWDEYGILSKDNGPIINPIIGMASNSRFSLPFIIPIPSTACDYSKLSFVNESCSGGIVGSYNYDWTTSDVLSSFSSSTNYISGTVDLSGMNGVYTATSDLILYGNINSSSTVVINAESNNVKISRDINYSDGPYTKISEIPQVIIIANNINIESAVKNIDAWLVAKDGTINTCSDVVIDSIRTSNCNNQLVVNGPVIAKKMSLYRTFGADSTNGYQSPAEIFNLRADTYLWVASQADKNVTIRTTYTIEQPPRF